MQLSPHFTLEEFCASATLDTYNELVMSFDQIINNPSQAEIDWMKYLCVNVLEPLRAEINHPIILNSGYRCPRLNSMVGGTLNSQHQYGQAADIRLIDNEDALKIFSILRNNKFVDLAFLEKRVSGVQWIHVSVAPVPRNKYIV